MASCELRPGPEYPSLLRFQDKHVSQHVWNGKPDRILKCRRARGRHFELPQQIVPLLRRAGFLAVAKVAFFSVVESDLITALVERWRPETHTFHLPPGECSITLQDMAVLMGLSVDGLAVTSDTSSRNWREYVHQQLGVMPSASELHGSTLKMKFLQDHFSDINDHVGNEQQLQRFTRAYILRLIGGVIFADHSSSRVPLRYLHLLEDLDICGQYAWGAAALSYLYRQLCLCTNYDHKEICGLTILVQLWAWERFPILTPACPNVRNVDSPYGARWFTGDTNTTARGDLDHYRQVFDMMKRDEIIWEPYPDDTLGTLCEICLRGRDAWRATVPLICFQIVEWHQPDRVMRQFGMQQHIPSAPRQPDNIHGITLRGKTDENWSATYVPLIQLWSCRSENVCTTDPQIGILSASSEYMRWYTSHTRRWITRKYAIKGRTTDVLEVIQYLSSPEGRSNTISLTDLLDSIRHEAENILFFMKEEDRLIVARTNAPVLTQEPTPVEVEINMPKKRVECQGIARGRAREEAQQYIIPPLPPRQEGSYRVPSQEPASSLMLTYQYHPS